MKMIYKKDELVPAAECPLLTMPFVDLSDWEKNQEDTEVVLIAATTETLRWGLLHKLPTLAYASPRFPQEDYSGAKMLVEGFEEVDDEFILRFYQRERKLPWTIVQTKRCIIRELTLEDLPRLFELYDTPGMTDYMEGLFPYEQEYEYQKAYIENMYGFFGYGMWLVFHKETGMLIGRAGLEHYEDDGQTYLELGYAIHPQFWRQGYATEVCGAILDFARENTLETKLYCRIHQDNIASLAFIEKLGGILYLKKDTFMVYNISL